MIRVGAVNIDTSHPMGFGEVMKQTGRARYVAVYNDSFRDDAEVEGFMRRFGISQRCRTIEELAECCDIGFIHGCNWDDHLRCAIPFLAAGKPVFIDKPLVGNLTDIRRVEDLTRQGAVILGASSARYAYEIQHFLAIPEEERGQIVQIFGTAGVDEFNYGIHIVEAVGGILGSGAQWVRYLGRGQADGCYSESYYVQYDGPSAIFNTFTDTWQPFVLTIMTTKSTYNFRLDSNQLYAALLDQICNYMEGLPNLLADTNVLLESIRVMLAAASSRAQEGRIVSLSELEEDGPSYDGRLFWQGYAASSGSMYALCDSDTDC